MEERAKETFDKITGAAYLIAVNQYALNSSTYELGDDNDQFDQNKRAAQIARSTLLSDTSVSIVSGTLATFKAVKKGSGSNHFNILKFHKLFSFESF